MSIVMQYTDKRIISSNFKTQYFDSTLLFQGWKVSQKKPCIALNDLIFSSNVGIIIK